MKKRVLSILCVLALCLSLLPVTALADDEVTYLTWDEATNSFETKTCATYTSMPNGYTETWGTDNADTWYVVDGDVNITREYESGSTSGITVKGNVHIILKDNSSLNIDIKKNGYYSSDNLADYGLIMTDGASLTIYAQTEWKENETADSKDNANVGKFTLNFSAWSSGGIGTSGVAIEGRNAGLTIMGGNVSVESGLAAMNFRNECTFRVFGGNFTARATGSYISGYSRNAVSFASYDGSTNQFVVSGGVVNITSINNTAIRFSRGASFYGNTEFTVSGGILNVTYGNSSYGIIADGSASGGQTDYVMNLQGGTVVFRNTNGAYDISASGSYDFVVKAAGGTMYRFNDSDEPAEVLCKGRDDLPDGAAVVFQDSDGKPAYYKCVSTDEVNSDKKSITIEETNYQYDLTSAPADKKGNYHVYLPVVAPPSLTTLATYVTDRSAVMTATTSPGAEVYYGTSDSQEELLKGQPLIADDSGKVSITQTGLKAFTQYTYYFIAMSNGVYSSVVPLTFRTLNKMASVVEAPKAIDLTYNGEDQELVTAGEAEGGTMEYSLNGQDYSTEIPKGKDAGTYTVWYKAVGTYGGSEPVSIQAIIKKMEITAAVTGSVTKEYDGGISVPENHSLNIQFTGVIEADKNDVTADTSKISYTYKDANIGEGKTITATGVTLSGSRAFNYQLTGDVTGSVGNITAIQIKELTSPTAPVLTEYYSNASEVIAKLPTATTGTTTSSDSVQITLRWSIKNGTSYNSAPSATNTFTWTATAPENYEFANDVTTSGEITVTNKAATVPSITATNKEDTYNGNAIDVSTMFTGVPDGSNPTYSIVEGGDTTGEGTLSGTGDLTVTKVGTFQIKVTTEAVGNYAAGEATATLTVNKGSFTATVSMSDYAQGGTPRELSVSGNKSGGTVTYYYNTTNTTSGGTEWTIDIGKTLDVGIYYMYAVIDATDLYNSCTTSATQFKVTEAAPSVDPPTAKDLTYTGEPQELVTAGSIEDGIMVYSQSENGEYSRAIPTGINAGTYTVWYKAESAAEASGSVSVTIQKAVIVSFDIPEDYYLNALYTKGEDVAALLRNEFNPATGRTANGTEIEIKITGWDYDIYINTRPSAVNEFEWWISQSNPYMDNYTLADSLLDGHTFASGTISVHNLPDVTINFDANGGSVQPTSTTTVNYKLASLPAPTRSGYVFDGWFTQETDGEEVTTDTVFIAGTTIYAHWSYAPTPVSPSYRVTVEDTDNGKVASSHSWAVPGVTVTLTVSPGEGYELASLSITKSNGDEVKYTDMGNGKFTFTMPASNVKVTAVFRTAYDACPRDESCPIWHFTDASTTAWYHDGIHYCLANGLMDGVADTLFASDASLTRAMLVTILWRVEGKPVVNYYMPFTDVDGGAWYAEAVRWAASEGIVNGVTDTSFAPDDPITREQLAAILWRYAKAKGYDVSIGEETNILSYEDLAQISEYAIPSMQWACGAGIINGVTESTLVPQGTATRAQAATMLMRFCESAK